MKRLAWIGTLWVLAVGLLGNCAAYRYQHAKAAKQAPAPDLPIIAPPPEWHDLSDAEQLARIRGEVDELKTNLARAGLYNCCVAPACNECLLKKGSCDCREVVEEEGPCCGECTEAWVEGKGMIEGIEAWELLERKKKALKPATAEDPAPPHRH